MTDRMATWALVGLLAVGCMSTGHFTELPAQDRDRFLRCKRAMQPALCGDDRDPMFVANCIRDAESTYSEQPGPQGRRQWLIEEGCPPPMVNPAPYIASEPPDAPMPHKTKPKAVNEDPAEAGTPTAPP